LNSKTRPSKDEWRHIHRHDQSKISEGDVAIVSIALWYWFRTI